MGGVKGQGRIVGPISYQNIFFSSHVFMTSHSWDMLLCWNLGLKIQGQGHTGQKSKSYIDMVKLTICQIIPD